MNEAKMKESEKIARAIEHMEVGFEKSFLAFSLIHWMQNMEEQSGHIASIRKNIEQVIMKLKIENEKLRKKEYRECPKKPT